MTRTDTDRVQQSRKTLDKRKVAVFAAAITAAAGALLMFQRKPPPRAKHTSILTGQQWVEEILLGHPGRFRELMGMGRSLFRRLCQELQLKGGLRPARYVFVDEQVAIWLFFVRTGQTSRILQERFQ